MQSQTSFKILFVINPGSGTKSKIDWESVIHAYFKPLQHHYDILLLTGKDDASSVKYWLENVKPERVIAVGGDGTVSLVAELLLGSNIAMGILPAGSANGMAKELQIPTNAEGAMDVIINGEIKCSDAIRINNEISIHLSDLGINAQIIKFFDQGNIRGKWGYAKMLIRALIRKQLIKAHIVTDTDDIRTAAFMIVIANASKYGTGALINPEGNLHDGLFEVVIVRRIAFSEFIKLFFRYTRFNPKKVEVLQTKTLTIETSKKIHFQVDGEYLGKINKISAKILPSQLNLILPSKNR